MNTDTMKFHAHQALPEDLAHKIFEAVRGVMPANMHGPLAHDYADQASKEIQQAVADAFAELTFKLINRRTPTENYTKRALAMPSVKDS
jgi:hypothetical protein